MSTNPPALSADQLPYVESYAAARPGERTIKQLIWAYFWLLIFEGALRKWFLPFLATPLLIVRDPFALGAMLLYLLNGYRFWNWYTIVFVGSTLISLAITLGYGHGNLFVGIYGFRIYAIHFPLMFIIGDIFDRHDVEQLGRALLWIAIPTTILVGLQFYSPQSAWVNRGVGGDLEGAGFSGANGFYRPSGLFSFTNGNSLMFNLAACFVMYFWRRRDRIWTPLLLAATACILVMAPLSISRTYIFQMGITFFFLMVASFTDVRSLFGLFGMLLGAPILLLVLTQFGFVGTSLDALLARFSTASEAEGGFEGTFVDRFLGGFLRPIENLDRLPFWGLGLGMGTNVGSQLLTGKVSYLIDEGEWGRVLGESGVVLGLLNLFVRVQLGVTLLLRSFTHLFTVNALAWILVSFSFINTFNVLAGQPTALGFAVLAVGLTIAALNEPAEADYYHAG